MEITPNSWRARKREPLPLHSYVYVATWEKIFGLLIYFETSTMNDNFIVESTVLHT